ncbi:hypothetical protein [Sphingomonas sp.]|uniref:hypothetical protein n=1 Tax=Sphingomonas sp. TaxID=28214 RepID=UPI003B3ADE9D
MALTGCSDLCSSDPVQSVSGPDGVTARLEKKNCDATVGYVYEVKAIDHDGSSQVVLRFDANHAVDWPDDAHLVTMHWQTHQLKLDLLAPVRVFRQQSKLNGVPVVYQFAPGSEL